jgi:hypothetical protein
VTLFPGILGDNRCPTEKSSWMCFTWFVNRISEIFNHVRVLFYADDMKLFLPRQRFSGLFENSIGSEQTVTRRTRHLVEFSYMLTGSALDRVSSINDLGVKEYEYLRAC